MDSEAKLLKSAETNEPVFSPGAPVQKFWPVTVYELETGGTFFDEVPKVVVSSKNADLV